MAANALFTGDVGALDHATLAEICRDVPSTSHSLANLAMAGVTLVDLLVETGLAPSKRQAREWLDQGSIALNGRRVGQETTPAESDLLPGGVMLLRRGKRNWHAAIWT